MRIKGATRGGKRLCGRSLGGFLSPDKRGVLSCDVCAGYLGTEIAHNKFATDGELAAPQTQLIQLTSAGLLPHHAEP